MYILKECISKHIYRIIIMAIFPVILISGCDGAKTSGPPSPATAVEIPVCKQALRLASDKNPMRFSSWQKESTRDNNQSYTNELANIETDQGKTLKYYSLAIVIQIDKTTKQLAEESFIPQEAQLQATALDSLIASAQECYKAAPPADNARLIRYSFMLDSATEYSKVVEERIKRHWDNVPYNPGEQNQIGGLSEWMVKGSAGKVIRSRNKVISDFNQLY